MDIVTRQEAAKSGLKKYFTGVACKNGHISQRYTVSTLCLACNAENQRSSRRNINLTMMGFSELEVHCHPDDVAAVKAYADMLNMARGVNPPKPHHATAAPQPPTTPQDSDAQKLAMWTRVHGEALAKQMLTMGY